MIFDKNQNIVNDVSFTNAKAIGQLNGKLYLANLESADFLDLQQNML